MIYNVVNVHVFVIILAMYKMFICRKATGVRKLLLQLALLPQPFIHLYRAVLELCLSVAMDLHRDSDGRYRQANQVTLGKPSADHR